MSDMTATALKTVNLVTQELETIPQRHCCGLQLRRGDELDGLGPLGHPTID